MEGKLPGNPSQVIAARERPNEYMPSEPQCITCKWYFSRQEIEDHTPSRKDGVGYEQESELRKLYCSFLRELGIELNVPQLTIATAMMLCHRFYMHQSHAKNDWQTIATVSMFLACKAEETPRWLSDVTTVAYKLMYKWDPSAPRKIAQRDVYDKQKALIVNGERLLLSTVSFDLNIEHPYKPLVGAMKRLEISNKNLAKAAWNYVNDWLRTTLCLQYKPHYIAAGSLYFAAKLQRVKLPTEKGKVWWMQFDVSPKQFEEVIQQMRELLEKNLKQSLPPLRQKVIESKPAVPKAMPSSSQSASISGSKVFQLGAHGDTVDAGIVVKSMTPDSSQSCITSSSKVVDSTSLEAIVDRLFKFSNSPQSCIVSRSNAADDVIAGGLGEFAMSKCSENEAPKDFCCQTSDCGSVNSAVEDGDGEPKIQESDQNPSSKIVSVLGGDVDRIREALKRRKRDKVVNKDLVEAIDDEIDSEAWIERELENGIELGIASGHKRVRV